MPAGIVATVFFKALQFLKKILCRRPAPEAARIGRMGEGAAARRLNGDGYKILARNFRSGRNEIDIVCSRGGVLVFVEVKTRKEGSLVGGYYSAVSGGKKRAVRAAAKDYMRQTRAPFKTFRFDVVEVSYSQSAPQTPQISHFQNVY